MFKESEGSKLRIKVTKWLYSFLCRDETVQTKQPNPKHYLLWETEYVKASQSRWSQIRTCLAQRLQQPDPVQPYRLFEAAPQSGKATCSLHNGIALHRYSWLAEQGRGGQADYTPERQWLLRDTVVL